LEELFLYLLRACPYSTLQVFLTANIGKQIAVGEKHQQPVEKEKMISSQIKN
jgi:hypothetical protein